MNTQTIVPSLGKVEEINEYDVDKYTSGNCWLLARELYELTGWDLLACIDDYGRWSHMGVRHPDGRFIDIHGGLVSDEDVLEQYGGGSKSIRVIDVADLPGLTVGSKFELLNGDLQDAERVAKLVLQEVQ